MLPCPMISTIYCLIFWTLHPPLPIPLLFLMILSMHLISDTFEALVFIVRSTSNPRYALIHTLAHYCSLGGITFRLTKIATAPPKLMMKKQKGNSHRFSPNMALAGVLLTQCEIFNIKFSHQNL